MMRSLATRSGRVRTGIFGLAATVALAAACSSEPPIPGADGEQGEGGEGGFTLVGSGSAEPCNGGSACAEITATAEVVPLTVYILFDKSVSMLDDGKWEAATQALTQFFESKQAARLRIALKFFPGTNPCQSSFYKVPDVALGTLTDGSALDDTHEQAQWGNGRGVPLDEKHTLRCLPQHCVHTSNDLSTMQQRTFCVSLLLLCVFQRTI